MKREIKQFSDQDVQTTEIENVTEASMIVVDVNDFNDDEDTDGEIDEQSKVASTTGEMHWAELSEIEEVYEEDEFRFEPKTGDCMEQYNERRVYQAEMSMNNKQQLKEITQSQDKLLQMKTGESKKMNSLNTT